MNQWRCLENCGACCHLEPSDRPDLESYLTTEQLKLYLSMVGEDGWCINYNHFTKECRIYPNRPNFCRVQPDTFKEMYGIEPEELNECAIDCCQEHIEDMYGKHSLEMLRFNHAVGINSGFQR